MRILWIILLTGCTLTAQQPSEDLAKDYELEQLLQQTKATTERSLLIQKKAAQAEQRIVKEAVNTIQSLKIELNEIKAKLDSASSDSIVPVKLLPISH
jgi:hypothetical protein